MSNEAQGRGDEELMVLIDEHEPLLRHIIGLGVHNMVDVDNIFQETMKRIHLSLLRK